MERATPAHSPAALAGPWRHPASR